jgi:Zn-dependent peptidase ImmA (M78 family)
MDARATGFRAARDARTRLGVGNESRLPDLLDLIEEVAGVPVFIERLPDGMYGAYRQRAGRPYILVSASVAPVRQRFTLAHEYGHHVLGHGSLVETEATLRDYSRDPKEVEANYFAAEFLAPVRAVENWMEARGNPEVDLEVVVRLADAFGISASAARIRLETARFLKSRAHTNDLKARIEGGEHKYLETRLGLGDLTDELWRAQKHVPRKPAVLFDKELVAYERGYVSLDRTAAMLEMPRDELEHILNERGITPAEDDDPDFSTGDDSAG